jgi:thiopurine S-methyltransferase
MEKSYWLQRWIENSIGFHKNDYNYFLAKHLPKGNQALVPLCGKSPDLLFLAKNGYKTLGVECSLKAILSFFGENALSYAIEKKGPFESFKCREYPLEILLGDFFNLEQIRPSIDFIYDRASLVALPKSMRGPYSKILCNLEGQRKMLLVAMDLNQEESAGPPFLVTDEELDTLFGRNFEIELLEKKEVDGVAQRAYRFTSRGT